MDPKQPPKRPYNPEDDDYLFDEEMSVASSTECTGMMPTPSKTEDEIESYSKIYDIPLAVDDQESLND